MDIDPAWLAPTWFVDSDSDDVGAFTERAVDGAADPTERAVRLFHAVRDGFRYDPYGTSHEPEAFRASTVTRSSANWCVPKSVLLTAAARRAGIPARLGFADVRNHLTSAKLSERMGTDLFAWHGYSVLLLGERWFKVSSAFNIELCQRFGTKVLEFDGTADALMHPYDEAGNRHMEYVHDRGVHDDLPLDDLLATFAELYPHHRDAGSDGPTHDEAFHGTGRAGT
jgi:transglutaminase-like putative cysteine protease